MTAFAAGRACLVALAGAFVLALGKRRRDCPRAESPGEAGNMDAPDIPLRKLRRCEAVLQR